MIIEECLIGASDVSRCFRSTLELKHWIAPSYSCSLVNMFSL